MDFAAQEQRPEKIVAPEYQSFPSEGSDDTLMPPVHVGDYNSLPKALQRSHFFDDPPTPSQEKMQGQSNAVVPEQAQRSELKQTVAPTYQSFAPRGSDESLMPPVHAGDYNSLPKALQRSHFFDDPPAPSQEKGKGPSKGASAPMRVAQADMGMSDDFWWKALATAGLAILKGGEYVITGSEKAVEDLYRNWAKTHQGTTNPQQVLQSTQDHGGGKNAQHGKAENKPSKEKQIEEYEKHLEELTRTQGSKKEKAELKRKIENVKKSMAQDKKGENHSQKAKK
jgi:hypothetical protein